MRSPRVLRRSLLAAAGVLAALGGARPAPAAPPMVPVALPYQGLLLDARGQPRVTLGEPLAAPPVPLSGGGVLRAGFVAAARARIAAP